jgi:excinuclease ABC subunit C
MHQVVTRRFTHLKDGDSGFNTAPDLLLIDGGITHAQTALDALNELGISVPVFGMVKDDSHRTRALVTPDGREISISTQQSVFSFIGNIQEEAHRFALKHSSGNQSKKLTRSTLTRIKGIGEAKAKALLAAMPMAKIKTATKEELAAVKGISERDAEAIVNHFEEERKKKK